MRTGRAAIWLRWVAAGPITLIGSALIMAGMTAWLPAGRAGIDHIAFPIMLFPAIWALLFFYAVLESRPGRALLLIVALSALHAIPVVDALGTMREKAALAADVQGQESAVEVAEDSHD